MAITFTFKGQNRKGETVSGERQAKERLLFAVFRNTRHERAIELHGVEGEPRHRRKIRIARAEIVHRKAYAQLPEQAYSLAHDIWIAHRDRLCDLDLEL